MLILLDFYDKHNDDLRLIIAECDWDAYLQHEPIEGRLRISLMPSLPDLAKIRNED